MAHLSFLKLTYRYLLKAGHVPGDTWGGANFGPRGHNLNRLGRGPLGHATYQRVTFICAHAWIFFKLCILISHYIRTMKMYLSN